VIVGTILLTTAPLASQICASTWWFALASPIDVAVAWAPVFVAEALPVVPPELAELELVDGGPLLGLVELVPVVPPVVIDMPGMLCELPAAVPPVAGG